MRERRQELSSSTFLAPNHPGKDYVSLCVVARDAHADMLEWLNHHIRWVLPCGCSACRGRCCARWLCPALPGAAQRGWRVSQAAPAERPCLQVVHVDSRPPRTCPAAHAVCAACRLGVGKVYLWDHASEPPMKRIVQVSCAAGSRCRWGCWAKRVHAC